MKLFNFHGIICAVFAALCLSACSPKVQQVVSSAEVIGAVQATAIPRLTKIEVDDLPASTQILLEAEDVLNYTSFNLSDPPRLIIDLADISLGEFKEPISVNKGSVIDIYPIEADTPGRITRLNIKLVSDSVESQIFRKDGTLVVDIPKIPPTLKQVQGRLYPSPLEGEGKGGGGKEEEVTAEAFAVEPIAEVPPVAGPLAIELPVAEPLAAEPPVEVPSVEEPPMEVTSVAEPPVEVPPAAESYAAESPLPAPVAGVPVSGMVGNVRPTPEASVSETTAVPDTSTAKAAVSEADTPPIQKEFNIVKDVKSLSSDDKDSIVITADKDINAETFIVEGGKLVVDIKDATHSIYPSEKPVESSLISKIRIGLHPAPVNKVRVVADLKREIRYDVSRHGSGLTIDIFPKSGKITLKKPDEKTMSDITGASAETPLQKGDASVSAPPADTKESPATVTPPPAPLAAAMNTDKVVSEVSTTEVREEKPAPPPQVTTNVPEKKNGTYASKKVSLDFQDADIVNVLRLLAEVSRLNMIIGDNVKGRITIKMLDVPWDQALDVILKMKGLGKIFENNVVRIDTLANIAQQQEEEARAKEAMVKAEDLETKIFPVNYARGKEVAESVRKTLSARGDITVDDRTNTLIIKDVKDKHEEISRLLKALDRPTPQVLIEARIVQADTNFAKDLGIQWGGDYSSNPGSYNIGVIGGPTGTVGAPTTGFVVNLPASGVAGAKGSLGFTIGKTVGDAFNLDLRLSAGETKGLTKVLSAPKIATLDNREATIQQGESIPYKTVSQGGTKTEFIDATLTLKVTPKVTPDGHIAMNIKITKNRQGSIVVEGTPSINKKEATTEVLVKDGETTVIGGIYEISDVDNLSAVPWVHQVPLLGWLFKSTQKSNIKSELLIFITPKIIPVTL
ncbi:MAG: type IV pilus secretin PilQ [Nitrospirae bacterium]|nr:type IV pilus secretin PilQ [Nitrospirota bacterium]